MKLKKVDKIEELVFVAVAVALEGGQLFGLPVPREVWANLSFFISTTELRQKMQMSFINGFLNLNL